MILSRAKQAIVTLATLAVVGVSLFAVFQMTQGAKFLSVQSGSMAPAYSKGDLVVVTRVPNGQYAVGDVVTFTSAAKQQTITHRIIELPASSNGNKFITKGDANSAVDPGLQASQLVGRVSYGVPFAGYFIDFVRQPLGLALFIYGPALLIVAAELRRLAAYYKSREPFIAAGCHPRLVGGKAIPDVVNRKKILVSIMTSAIFIAGISLPVYAALTATAVVTGSSISTFSPSGHLLIHKIVLSEAGNSNTSNTNDLNISNSSEQDSYSGDAISNSGDATSGSVSNSNSTSTNIRIDNGTAGTQQMVILYNPTNAPISLSDWTLRDDSRQYAVSPGGEVPPGGYFTFGWPVAGGLSAVQDRLILKDSNATTVDAVSWGSDTSQLQPPINLGSAKIFERRAFGLDTDTADDWRTL